MLDDILFALWFFIPAGVANMAPIFAAQLPGLRSLEAPLDFGATYRSKRIFGAHKTWRGLVAGTTAAAAVFWLQQYIIRENGWWEAQAASVEYVALPTVLMGVLFAVGALGGDAIKSFFKRQLGKTPGQAWPPYDLIDHIIGAALVTAPLVLFDWWIYPVVVLLWVAANLTISYIGYLLHIKERPL